MKAKLTKTITAIFLFAIPVSGFGQIAPNLNSAADFAILAATEIAFNGPVTTIDNLDIGLSPGTSISGNYSLVNGVALTSTTDETPPRLPQAIEDLRLAYLFAAAAPVTEPTISGNQGGKTLEPGVYKSGSILSIEGSPLYLDAKGNANAVWIFQIESSLTTTVGGDVILMNGANADNVYWQVGSSATIGDGTDFKGNILALVSITVNTGATIEGRALARTGAVTFAGGGTMAELEESQAAPGALTITKTADPQTFFDEGDLIDYEIVVTNTGDAALENITVEDELAPASPWPILSLDPGMSETITFSYNITEADFQNGFVLNIATAEAVDILESASAYVVVTKEGLLISKVATPKTYYAIGQVINYDIVVENTGTETVTFTVFDDLTDETWPDETLGPGKSQIFETSYAITGDDMLLASVDNTATATVSETTVFDTESVLRVNPPPPVPLTTWAIVLGGILIAGFVFFQYRRSTPKRV